MYASLLISLLAAFVAMLGKQWLNRYLRNSGGSVIERCGDRQRKWDGLERWPLHLFIESLPVMLQAALFLLACGLCRYMWSINASVAWVLIGFTGLGAGFYVGIVIAGTSSYACPFQTPVSMTLHSQWKKVSQGITSFKQVFPWGRQVWNRRIRPLLHHESPPTISLEVVEVQRSESRSTLDSTFRSERRVKPKEPDVIRRTNTNDVRCVSWILRNITDPEALDAAIRLAGEIWWFDDGLDVNPPFDLIVSVYDACFDSGSTLYPGSRDRAYYSGRAILWIHALAVCKFPELAKSFSPPQQFCAVPGYESDLNHLICACANLRRNSWFGGLFLIWSSHYTPSHVDWVSNLLLHLSRASRAGLDFGIDPSHISLTHEITALPINYLITWCILLGSPIEEDILKFQDE